MEAILTGRERLILYLLAVLAILGSVAVAFLFRKIVFDWLRRRAARTKTQVDSILIAATRGPFVIWCICGGVYAASRIAILSAELTRASDKVLIVLLIVSVTYAAAQAAIGFIRHTGTHNKNAVAYVGLTQTTVRIAILVLGGLVLLHSLGISITPMITALGIGGLAVALALQNTLANTFAGIYITLSRHIRPGDFLRLDTGEEGVVTDITWRATTIRTIRNNIIIIPNDRLAQAIITNFNLADKRYRLDIEVGVSYSSDPEHVERILIDVANKAVGEVEHLLDDPEPYVSFHPGFGDSSLGFALVVHISSYARQYRVRHHLRKRIFARFRKEGIEIPFPIRTVYLNPPATRPAPPAEPPPTGPPST
ncbi:MAG: mechanosensitive ion channel [bacterium]